MILFVQCCQAHEYINPAIKDGQTVIIDGIWDLGSQSIELPKNVILDFKGGRIQNGELIGVNTKIKGDNEHIFIDIIISGSWLVPYISTNMFQSNDKHLFENLTSLTNKAIRNIIVVEKGTYDVIITEYSGCGLLLQDNTHLIIAGQIRLAPNSFEEYDIIKVQGRNITIEGNGAIIGDKNNHKGDSGEWGMGIRVRDSYNVIIKKLSVKSCWGDCIYIGHNSSKIVIDNCLLEDSRRQGISITSGNDIQIRNCNINDIKGTNPQAAIDIEPNAGQVVDKVKIKNVHSDGCLRGIMCYGKVKDAYIGKVVIENCDVKTRGKCPYNFQQSDNIILRSNKGSAQSDGYINFESIAEVTCENNTINVSSTEYIQIKDCLKTRVRNNQKYRK